MSRINSYFRYFLYKVNEHSLHSPLVYDLYKNVIKNGKKRKPDPEIEKLHRSLKNSATEIDVSDYGTGKNRASRRKLSEIARHASSPVHQSILLQGLANYFGCVEILELGTSLGLTTLYLSKVPDSIITTFEGCPELASIAVKNVRQLNRSNVRVITGNIDSSLPDYLARSEKLDFVFFDANHAYQPTINYYNLCFKKAHDHSVFVFDDIHHSKEMEQAWHEISTSVEVTLSVDIYDLGIILFDPSLTKQSYTLSY